MDRRDTWFESDNRFFDATTASQNEWTLDAQKQSDEPASDVSGVARSAKTETRPSTGKGRVMVIGWSVIRL